MMVLLRGYKRSGGKTWKIVTKNSFNNEFIFVRLKCYTTMNMERGGNDSEKVVSYKVNGKIIRITGSKITVTRFSKSFHEKEPFHHKKLELNKFKKWPHDEHYNFVIAILSCIDSIVYHIFYNWIANVQLIKAIEAHERFLYVIERFLKRETWNGVGEENCKNKKMIFF